MQERVKYDEIRNLADRKHSWSKYFFGVAVDVGEQSANNKHYISNVIFPLIPIALASISVVVAGATALSTLVFGAIAFITSAYQAKRAKEGMDEKTNKLKKEMVAFEEEIIRLVRLYQELETQRKAKILSAEFIDEEQSKIVDTFRVLLDRIDLGGKSRSQKLYQLLQHQKINEITATIDKICQKMMFGRKNRDDHAIQAQLSGVLNNIEKPRPMNPHIRRLLYAGVGLGGLSLGFGLGFAAVSALVIITFPWSILPAVAAGLIIGGIFLARYHFLKKGTERDQAEMKLAKGQVKGLKQFVSKIYTDIKNTCTNLFDRESAKQEKAQEMQAQVEQERVTIRKAQEAVERRELIVLKDEEVLERKKEELDQAQSQLFQAIKTFCDVKGKFENEKIKLQDNEKQLIDEKNQLQEKMAAFEDEKQKFQREYTQRDEIWKEREAQIAAKEKALVEKEELLAGEKEQKQDETKCEDKTDTTSNIKLGDMANIGLFNTNKHSQVVQEQKKLEEAQRLEANKPTVRVNNGK